MRAMLLLLAIGSSPVAAAEAARAQSSVTGPDITVTGENRIICRRVTRTATRMRTGRICRTQAEWARAPNERNATRVNANDTIDEAADTLDALRADCIGTGDGSKSPLDTSPDTPLGPR